MDFFCLGPIYKLFKSHVYYALKLISRVLGPIKFCKGPVKNSKDPLKIVNMHPFVNEWDIGSIRPLVHFNGPSSFWARIIPVRYQIQAYMDCLVSLHEVVLVENW